MTVTPVAYYGNEEETYWDIPDLALSAARTTPGNGTPEVLPSKATQLRFQLDVTAVSGTTPTLDVVIEDTIDGTNYNTLVAFTQKTAVGREAKDITGVFSRNIRARWTTGGTTPNFTFSVKGLAKSFE